MPRARLSVIAVIAVIAALALVGDARAFGVVAEALPVGATGQPYDYQFRVHGGNPPYTFSVPDNVLPPGLSLSPSGKLTGVPLVTGSWRFFVDGSYTYRTNPPRHSQRQFTLDVVVGLSISNVALATATKGVPYSARLTAGGGGAQTWSVSGRGFPPGLSLTPDGLVRGIPTRTGTFAFTIAVRDDERWTERPFSVAVVAAPKIDVPSLPRAVVGSPFTARLTVSGGRAPYTWTLRGAHPPGISVVGTALRGIPAQAGRYSFRLVLRDAAGNTTTRRVDLVVGPRPPASTQTFPG